MKYTELSVDITRFDRQTLFYFKVRCPTIKLDAKQHLRKAFLESI